MKKEWILVLLALIIAVGLSIDTFIWIFNWGTGKIDALFSSPEKEEAKLEEETRFKPVIDVAAPRVHPEDFQAGMGVLVYGNDPQFEEKVQKMLNHLVSININSVSLAFPLFQDDWQSSRVYIDDELTLSEENLRIFIREAHRRNLTVMVRPILDEKNLLIDNRWRGSIRPNESDLWFRNYTDIILNYAIISDEEDAEIFSIGTELSSLEKETDRWLALIGEIRFFFGGQLIYSVNWQNAFDGDVGFWEDLDFVGISAFFPLDVSTEATVEELVDAWQQWVLEVNKLKEYYKKPVVFTEAGTMSQAGSYQRPWIWGHGTPVDLEAQRIYYMATCRASFEAIDGIYWWFAELDPAVDQENDPGFNPLGKPAENVITECFEKNR